MLPSHVFAETRKFSGIRFMEGSYWVKELELLSRFLLWKASSSLTFLQLFFETPLLEMIRCNPQDKQRLSKLFFFVPSLPQAVLLVFTAPSSLLVSPPSSFELCNEDMKLLLYQFVLHALAALHICPVGMLRCLTEDEFFCQVKWLCITNQQ